MTEQEKVAFVESLKCCDAARIAELEAALAEAEKRITELETSVQDYKTLYQHEATHNALRQLRIAELEAERHYLHWFHTRADFGPADYDVVVAMQVTYEKETGKAVPEDWRYEDDDE